MKDPFKQRMLAYIKTRIGTTDAMTLNDIVQYRHLPIPKGCSVLDIGGHIGTFTNYALERGASRVVTYEPEPSNFAMLEQNTIGKSVAIFNKAVTGDGREVQLNVKTNGHSGGHSIYYDSPERNHIRVPSEAFASIVERVRPDVVKIDCEGAEYEFDIPFSLPRSVKYLTIEIHTNRKEWRTRLAPKMIADFARTWNVLKQPKITPRGWATIAVWEKMDCSA